MTVTTTPPVTAEVMNRALWTHFAAQQWAVLFEIGARAKDFKEAGRRIDVLAARPARRMGIGSTELLAIEVKVTRADFLSDVRRPEKQAAWKRIAHRHAYAVPKGLVSKDEVPEECGLIEVEVGERHNTVAWTKKAPYTPTDTELPGWLISNLMLRCSWAEGQMKGYSGSTTYDPHGEDTVESLRARLRNETRAREKATAEAARQKKRAKEWRSVAGLVGAIPCSTCGELLRVSRFVGGYARWVHVDKAHEEPCEPMRLAAAEEKARQDAERLGWANPYPIRQTPAPEPDDPDDEDTLL